MSTLNAEAVKIRGDCKIPTKKIRCFGLVSTYILNMWFVNLLYRYTTLNDQTVLFLTIQFSINQQR